jgi:4-hydroxy-tetrahydrodipicolinate reductase
MSVRVAVAGAAGRMGRTVLKAVHESPETELVAAIDHHAVGEDAGALAGLGALGMTVTDDLATALRLSHAEVLVDFTRAGPAYENSLTALQAGVSPVIGTTGMNEAQLDDIRRASEEASLGAFLAPNFAVGAVLMMLFARQAARYLPEVEVIEFHGPQKVDAPSGTAMRTLDFILEGRGHPSAVRPDQEHFLLEGARGGEREGVRVHSVRLPGYVAHQECIFGDVGQTLTIRHDSTDRVSFMPGVILACTRVRVVHGLVVGLENLLEL